MKAENEEKEKVKKDFFREIRHRKKAKETREHIDSVYDKFRRKDSRARPKLEIIKEKPAEDPVDETKENNLGKQIFEIVNIKLVNIQGLKQEKYTVLEVILRKRMRP